MPLMGHHCKDMASLVYRVLPQMCEGVREGQLDKSMLQGAAFQVVFMVKNPSANAGDIRDVGSIPVSGRFPWRSAWQPTLIFLPGESHGQKSLAGYSL